MTSVRRSTVWCTVAVVGSLIVPACGDDESADDPSPTAAATTEAATTEPETTEPATTEPATTEPATTEPMTTAAGPPVCDPYMAVTQAFAGEPDPEAVRASLDDLEATAPDDIAGVLASMSSVARDVLDGGDPSQFESPEFASLVAEADAWMFDHCELATRAELVAVDFRYEGAQDAYPAGRAGFRLVNQGAETHEIALIRWNAGADATLEELLAMPEEQAQELVTFVGATFVPATGDTAVLLVDLEPGDYVAACFVPAGTTVGDDGAPHEGTGDPHLMLGMSFEFTVSAP